MISTAKEFLQKIVEPTVREFEDAPHDMRRGLLAAIVLNHLTDHVAMDGFDKTDRRLMDAEVDKVRSKMCAECLDFQFIRDVADVTKHAKLSVSTRPDARIRDVQCSDQMSSTPGLFGAPLGEGNFAEAVVVFATLSDGTEKSLRPAIRSALDAWRSKLNN